MKRPSRFLNWLKRFSQRDYSANPAGFEEMCRRAALLVEAERLAKLGSWEHDLATGAEIWSANLSELLGFGRSMRTISGSLFWELVHPEDREMVRTIIQCALKDHLPTYEYQCRFVLQGGGERVMFTRGKLLFDESNQLVERLGVTQDITMAVELGRALIESERALSYSEKELRRLSFRLLQLLDNERKQVSLILHEKASQNLAGMRMCIGVLIDDVPLSPSARNMLLHCQTIASDTINELNSLSQLLYPPLLEEGLVFAIDWHVSQFRNLSGIEVRTEISHDLGRLPETHERAFFRIVQECLNNIDRHSGSRWAVIRIERDRRQVTLLVQDGGKGISEQRHQNNDAGVSGVGMALMRERVRQLNGVFSLETSGDGVIVRATLPTPEAEGQRSSPIFHSHSTIDFSSSPDNEHHASA